ncbi:uncharacterized protein involved in outer membrane biogenesis [Orenia metallireducens]|uniref:Uncharacterized protein involved in outer membrane biogenesis n=1 Tax=Orenia metallireducens TaxID=1413210 RepID=A0A285HMN8_9FIRM|nr:AsmA family protein [Orenia metallireducens]PRX26964.1 uncharacterized protein involved in outer membrane biogenesis [Orenia metallireducens]SNY36992.1 Uncharacterized protein involved in outer membrane biogenesis [Orenia metallireducens]
MKTKIEKDSAVSIKRLTIYLLLTILAILIGGSLYLKSYFNSDKLEKMIIPKLEETLDREVVIEDISLKFLSGFGLRIDGFKILNSDGFKEEYLAQFDTFNLDVALLPLLHKEIEIKEVSLIKPIIALEVNQSGDKNYQFGVEHKNIENNSKESSQIGLDLNLDKLEIVDGRVRYLDQSSKLDIKLDNIESRSSILLNGREERLITAGESQIGNIVMLGLADNLRFKDLDFNLEHQLNFDLAEKVLNFEKLNLSLGGFNLKSSLNLLLGEDSLEIKEFNGKAGDSTIGLKAKLIDFSNPKLALDLKTDLKLKELLAKLPIELDLDLVGQLSSDISAKNLKLKEFKSSIKESNLKGNLELIGLSLANNKLPVELKDINGQIKVSDKELTVDNLVVGIAEDRIKGSLLVVAWKEMLTDIINQEASLGGNLNLALEADTLNLDKLIVADNSEELADKKDKKEDNKKAFYLPDFNLTANLNIGTLAYQGEQYQNIAGSFNIAEFKVKIDKLEVNKGDSKAAVSGLVDYEEFAKAGDSNQIDANLNLDSDLNLALIKKELERLDPKFKDYQFAGRIEADLRTGFSVKDVVKEPLDNLDKIKVLGDISLSGERIRVPQLTGEIGSLEGTVAFDDKDLKLLDGRINLAESDLAAKVSVSDWRKLLSSLQHNKSDGVIDIELDSKLLSLDELLSFLPTSKDSATKEEAEEKELAELLPDFKVNSQVNIKELKYQKLKTENLILKAGLNNKVISIDNFETNIEDGGIKSNGKIDLARENPSYQGKLKVDNIEINRILSFFTDFDNKLYGKINLDSNLGGVGLELNKILESATLQGEALVAKGELKNFILIDKLNSWFSLFDDNKLDFKDLDGSINLKGGKLYLNGFKSKTEFGELEFAGYSTLKGDLNYKLTYLISEKKSQKLDLKEKELFYAPQSKRVQLDFKLKGSVTKPELSWDKSIVEERAKKKVEEKVDKKLEEGKGKVEEEKEKAKDKIKEELEEKKDEIKNIFKGLF